MRSLGIVADWIECPGCEGAEGWPGEGDGDWIECPDCRGEGGHPGPDLVLGDIAHYAAELPAGIDAIMVAPLPPGVHGPGAPFSAVVLRGL